MEMTAAIYFPIVGRVFIAILYIISAVGMIANLKRIIELMASKRVPMPHILLTITIVLWILGGVCLVLGWNVRIAAAAIFVVMIPVTLGIHRPWEAADPAEFEHELTHFLKNVGILGGLLYIMYFGAGPYSLG